MPSQVHRLQKKSITDLYYCYFQLFNWAHFL